VRKKELRYASLECDVEADDSPEDGSHQISLSSKAAGVIRCDSIESTPSRGWLDRRSPAVSALLHRNPPTMFHSSLPGCPQPYPH
jgi:hypothetical protein